MAARSLTAPVPAAPLADLGTIQDTRVHTRSSSNSFRIAIDHSSPPNAASPNAAGTTTTSASPTLSTPRRVSGPRGKLPKSPLSTWSTTLLAPFAPLLASSHRASSALAPPPKRRWPKLLLALAAAYSLYYLATRTAVWDPDAAAAALERDTAPPTVDRAALEKLRLLEIHFGLDDDDGEHPVHLDPPLLPADPADPDAPSAAGDHPPLVAQLPDPSRPNPLAPVRAAAADLDADVCPDRAPGEPCAFLLPAWLGEQETKAQLHLYQLGLLALALNRTLVLPNVAQSRLATCYPNPFSFYYADDSLDRLGIPTISQADFLDWAERRDPPASAQVVSMTGPKATYALGAIEIDSAADPVLVPNKPKRSPCLRAPRSRLDFSGHSPLAIYPPVGYHKSEAGRTGFGESVVNTLRSVDVGSKSSRASSSLSAPYALPNVLAFNYELRFPILTPETATASAPALLDDPPLSFSHFPYSHTWTDLATAIADTLSPFIAVHWRTETLRNANLVPCASALVSRLVELQTTYPNIKNIYLATDYPIESLSSSSSSVPPAPHSGTFAKSVTENHHAAFRLLLKDFKKRAAAKSLRLTTFALEEPTLAWPDALRDVLANTTSHSLAEVDPGLVGIVDKAVAMRAEVFLTGFSAAPATACAKVSSFTAQIVQAREEQIVLESEEDEADHGQTRTPGRLWNAASHWSVGGKDDD